MLTRQGPTATQQRSARLAASGLDAVEQRVTRLVDSTLQAIEAALGEAGAPWSP
jgi:hypothetical protein